MMIIGETARDHIKRMRHFLMLLAILGSSICSFASYRQTPESVIKAIDKGDSLYRRQMYVASLNEYISQLQTSRHLENDSLFLVLLSRIGSIYDNTGDFSRAIYYYDKILAHTEANDYQNLVASVLVKLVVGNYNSRNAKQARFYYEQQLRQPLADSVENVYYVLTDGALVNSLEGKHPIAVGYFRRALEHVDHTGMPEVYGVPVMLELAEEYQKVSPGDSAVFYLQKARDVSERLGLTEYAADCYKSFGDYYSRLGDKEKAEYFYAMHKDAKEAVDSHGELDAASLRLLQSHDMQAREEIDTLKFRIGLQTITIVVVILFCVMLAVFAFYTRRQHRRLKDSYLMLIKKNDQIIELEEQVMAKEVLPVTDELTEITEPTSIKRTDDDDYSSTFGELAERIARVMDKVDVISNPAFSLSDLSREVGSNTKYVSRAINRVYGKNFRTLLNERRIREAVRRLSDEAGFGKTSIVEIAESLGYGSSTVFINAFKKEIGMTPALYRRYRKESGSDAGPEAPVSDN